MNVLRSVLTHHPLLWRRQQTASVHPHQDAFADCTNEPFEMAGKVFSALFDSVPVAARCMNDKHLFACRSNSKVIHVFLLLQHEPGSGLTRRSIHSPNSLQIKHLHSGSPPETHDVTRRVQVVARR